ncbi:MAG: hypothetical protein IKE63_03725 [Bacilli bacterium]|nr:hypothetical protein [Bacilli bacterium]
MKLKKKFRILLLIILIVALAVCGFLAYKQMGDKKQVKEAKVVGEIKGYGYKLKDNKPAAYKKMFEELKEILEADKVDEEAYAKKISEMFVYDFYSLKDKISKTDIGGVDFVHPDVLGNFLENAQDTYYKYVENNIYNNRKQSLPVVSNIEVGEVKQETFEYGDKSDEKAYIIDVTWSYTDSNFSDYQKEAKLIFVHDDKKLDLVELQK